MELTHAYFFSIPKYYQNEIWWNTSVLYEKHFWNDFGSMLETGTSSRSFYDFIKMKIQQDLAIFNVWHLSSLIVSYSPFQKIETLKSWHYLLLSNWRRLLNWKDPELSPSFLSCSKYSWQLLLLLIFNNCSKDILKNAPCFMY